MSAPEIEIFQSLPQFEHLKEYNITKFISHINSFEPERLLDFHIPRLAGLGGSEIGEVIGEFMDNRSHFGNRRTVVRGKLLLDMPEKSSPHTLRGKLYEGHIRKFFREQTGAKAHDDILVKMNELRHSIHSWLYGRPDELVTIGNKLYLVDYKCPAPGFDADYDRDGVPFSYEAQLHHYDMLLADNGIKVDGYLIVAMDAVMPGVLYTYKIDKNPQIIEAITDIGHETWHDYVLTGELPPWPSYIERPEVMDPDNNKTLADMMVELTRLSSLESEINKRKATLKTDMSDLAIIAGINRPALHGAMVLNAKPKLDEEAILHRAQLRALDLESPDFHDLVPDPKKMLEQLQALGTPIENYMVQGALNVNAVKDTLVQLGEPEEQFNTFDIGFRVSTTKDGKLITDEIKSQARDLMEEFAPKVIRTDVDAKTLVEGEQPELPTVGLNAKQGVKKDRKIVQQVVGEVPIDESKPVTEAVESAPKKTRAKAKPKADPVQEEAPATKVEDSPVDEPVVESAPEQPRKSFKL